MWQNHYENRFRMQQTHFERLNMAVRQDTGQNYTYMKLYSPTVIKSPMWHKGVPYLFRQSICESVFHLNIRQQVFSTLFTLATSSNILVRGPLSFLWIWNMMSFIGLASLVSQGAQVFWGLSIHPSSYPVALSML